MESLAGRLLVATPTIEGDVFRRSVVLVLHHDDEGAHGLVLNKPMDMGVDTILPGWSDHLTAPGTLYQGGPVGVDTALGLVSVPGVTDSRPGIQPIFGGLGVVDLDAPPALVMSAVGGLRIFIGYAGWAPLQLEGEIGAHGWYVVPLEARDPFTPRPDRLWQTVLGRQKGSLAWVARFPSDPLSN